MHIAALNAQLITGLTKMKKQEYKDSKKNNNKHAHTHIGLGVVSDWLNLGSGLLVDGVLRFILIIGYTSILRKNIDEYGHGN